MFTNPLKLWLPFVVSIFWIAVAMTVYDLYPNLFWLQDTHSSLLLQFLVIWGIPTVGIGLQIVLILVWLLRSMSEKET